MDEKRVRYEVRPETSHEVVKPMDEIRARICEKLGDRSLKELAKAIRCSESKMCAWMLYEDIPDAVILKIAGYFGVKYKWLKEGKE